MVHSVGFLRQKSRNPFFTLTHLSPPVCHQVLSVQPHLQNPSLPHWISSFHFCIVSWCLLSCFYSILYSGIKVSFPKCKSDHVTVIVFLKWTSIVFVNCFLHTSPHTLAPHPPAMSQVIHINFQFLICHVFSLWIPLHMHPLCEECPFLPRHGAN